MEAKMHPWFFQTATPSDITHRINPLLNITKGRTCTVCVAQIRLSMGETHSSKALTLNCFKCYQYTKMAT